MKVRKHYTLSEEAIAHVDWIANKHGMNHSQTVDHLIKLGVKDDRHAIASFVGDVVAYEMRKQFNRFAKLTAMAALEAGAAKEAAQTIYTWILMQEHMGYMDSLNPDEAPSFEAFEKLFGINVNSTEGKQIITLLNKQKDRFRARSARSLKKGLSEIYEILGELEEMEQDGSEA